MLEALNILSPLVLLYFYIYEENLCSGVRSCYDEGKRTAETLTMDYHRRANVEVLTPLSL